MYTKEISYIDFNDQPRKEKLCFNMTKAEWAEFQFKGQIEDLETVVDRQDAPKIVAFMKELILSSYGIKSADGRRFDKSPEIRKDFESTQAFSDFFMSIAYDADAAAEFITHVLPSDLAAEADKVIKDKMSGNDSKPPIVADFSTSTT